MAFSKEEFDIMVEELLCKEPISFDMLCHIAEKTLKSKIKYWCQMDETLRGRGYEDDIMQEIQIRLMKTTIDYFLLKDGVEGPVNNDPKGFSSWMITVADNLKRDFANKIRRVDFKTDNIDDSKPEPVWVDDDMDAERKQVLKQAFAIVMSSDVNVYKILTWIAQFIFVIDCDVTKIQSNEKIIEMFEQKTLFEMYDMLYALSKHIAWIEISHEQNKKIIGDLNKPWDKEHVYGEIEYKEFFMKINGEKSGKKSISDWMNRMNNMLRKKLGEKNRAILTSCEGGHE